MADSERSKKAKALGINHVVLEVGDVDEALAFYGAIFDFTLRSQSETAAFIDLGDQFLQLNRNRVTEPDDKRHFGLVVDDREPVRAALTALGVELLERGLNFRDPWGNRVEIVPYDDIQFTKAPYVLRSMGTGDLKKTDNAIAQLTEKGMAPE
ncbi:MAG: VOC family protein [Rhodospirillaceae bacterium]|nr:VOC family protein [Rhodospirillaceae bacterium]